MSLVHIDPTFLFSILARPFFLKEKVGRCKCECASSFSFFFFFFSFFPFQTASALQASVSCSISPLMGFEVVADVPGKKGGVLKNRP